MAKKKNVKHLSELVFILDKSGSMEGLEKDTIGGFNSMMQKQRKQVGEASVTTILFDNNVTELYFRKDVHDVCKMTEQEYFVGGCTALLDAVGSTIQKVIHSEKEKQKKVKAEKVIFVIMTDGYENASHEYTYESVKKMITRQKKEGWEFLFLGANMDAVSEAAHFGISADRSVSFCNDSFGVALNYEVVGETLSSMRMAPCTSDMDGSWKQRIEEDNRKRGI